LFVENLVLYGNRVYTIPQIVLYYLWIYLPLHFSVFVPPDDVLVQHNKPGTGNNNMINPIC